MNMHRYKVISRTLTGCWPRPCLFAAVFVSAIGCAPLGHAAALPELIESALAFHPSIRAQQAGAASAGAAVATARWQFFPTPSISIERVNAPSSNPTYALGDNRVTILRLHQTLWSGGRLTAGLQKAQAAVLSSEASVESAKQELALRVVQYYADWYAAYYKTVAYEKSLSAHRRLREQTVRRIAEGASPASDLTLVVGRTEQTQADLLVAQAQQETALAHLSQLQGRPVTQEAIAHVPSAALDATAPLPDLLKLAQDASPNVARLMANARIQEAEIAERQADLKPELVLRLERQYGNYTYPNAPPENRVFLGVSTRFGAGLSSLSAITGARARYDAALADVETARIALSEQVLADHALSESGKVRLLALAQALQASESIWEAWNRQFLAGRKSWLDVMNAAREQAQVETQIADVNSAQLLMTWRLSLLVHGVEAVVAKSRTHSG